MILERDLNLAGTVELGRQEIISKAGPARWLVAKNELLFSFRTM